LVRDAGTTVDYNLNSETVAPHLDEIPLAVAPGAHDLLLLGQAGWRDWNA
jgi:hypothetical protein